MHITYIVLQRFFHSCDINTIVKKDYIYFSIKSVFKEKTSMFRCAFIFEYMSVTAAHILKRLLLKNRFTVTFFPL